jgi:hypothetical protein
VADTLARRHRSDHDAEHEAGLTVKRPRRPFRQQSANIGFKVDVTNVAEALELLEGPAAR